MNKISTKIKNFIKRVYKEFTKPSLIRVYSWEDAPKRYTGSGMWNKISINDEKLLEKIYHHISTASRIYYYCSCVGIVCSVKTKKFGWCLLEIRYDLNFTEFGIWRSDTIYQISYNSELEKYMPLYKFLKDFCEKAKKEYQNDKNL